MSKFLIFNDKSKKDMTIYRYFESVRKDEEFFCEACQEKL